MPPKTRTRTNGNEEYDEDYGVVSETDMSESLSDEKKEGPRTRKSQVKYHNGDEDEEVPSETDLSQSDEEEGGNDGLGGDDGQKDNLIVNKYFINKKLSYLNIKNILRQLENPKSRELDDIDIEKIKKYEYLKNIYREIYELLVDI